MKKNNFTWFVLGREPEISTAEITTVLKLPNEAVKFLAENILKINTAVETDLIKRLGGTIKIAEEVGSELTENELKEKIIAELQTITGKIHFGISLYDKSGQIGVKPFALDIKKELKKNGLSVRYVPSDEHNQLSSATVFHNQLTTKGREFLITKTADGFALAKTIAIQPFEELGARDFGRPGRDDFSGMLPPKLAMMMINLAQADLDATLLDPFCGSGTILTEAMILGYKNLIGSDISEKAIADTRKNVEWTARQFPISNFKFPINSQFPIYNIDIDNLEKKIKPHSIDTIITESYLGKPLTGRESESELRLQVGELKTLYLNAFRAFTKLLKKDGTVIFIIPRFFSRGQWITINCESEINNLGFKTVSLQQKKPYLLYGRPGQRVGREIWRFKKV
ncbi:MAG: hypothetical protein A3J93_05275 [Candidatus Magasanikbacteria bacterium RIFOXYC2_FULL_42_28]|uniref:Ribosomal RNA large subunit methyltransferase K/L-like methyltransferase domain-containing protein n=1 Tax=Candidatus Magasanikbacteria bacterium RIFOXYC2_FULL_42_28 TaxID=1798704 RepID=A0A1F6NV33_9BACT|nr:MAG: hypothetical protein A3J93_05275 [Candidatus Magasanikbacteria bacterium RIFOXYC2_FULL_42_28]